MNDYFIDDDPLSATISDDDYYIYLSSPPTEDVTPHDKPPDDFRIFQIGTTNEETFNQDIAPKNGMNEALIPTDFTLNVDLTMNPNLLNSSSFDSINDQNNEQLFSQLSQPPQQLIFSERTNEIAKVLPTSLPSVHHDGISIADNPNSNSSNIADHFIPYWNSDLITNNSPQCQPSCGLPQMPIYSPPIISSHNFPNNNNNNNIYCSDNHHDDDNLNNNSNYNGNNFCSNWHANSPKDDNTNCVTNQNHKNNNNTKYNNHNHNVNDCNNNNNNNDDDDNCNNGIASCEKGNVYHCSSSAASDERKSLSVLIARPPGFCSPRDLDKSGVMNIVNHRFTSLTKTSKEDLVFLYNLMMNGDVEYNLPPLDIPRPNRDEKRKANCIQALFYQERERIVPYILLYEEVLVPNVKKYSYERKERNKKYNKF
ncbi:hypothetical protein TRFO_07519 [Tritrichomonas foetus]|uniref:Uncharacterized protein n=1 Tax=Tritrichomonas foetus TaxID=1144522 RepID=A0A1J4JRF5_9EUKA|nr:hypothetical protein TRFO_07519 [Tritrichomonas foetus]|eukprot:OHT01611.1 hypothetical protein TRFO_07519 [Tritrichomonas foetus]